jgi:hypothetical protein
VSASLSARESIVVFSKTTPWIMIPKAVSVVFGLALAGIPTLVPAQINHDSEGIPLCGLNHSPGG